MIKRTLTATAIAAALAVPAFAQQPAANPGMASPSSAQQSSSQNPGFVQNQSANEWRGSKLIGASVYGPDNASIGEISDVIIGSDGSIKAAVIGVGGFLGVGQKDVAVPFDALNVTRTPDSNSINKITVSYTKDQLKSAPQFAYLGTGSNASTTGSGSSSSTSGSTSPMSK
jgi:sporulation protein YlmC with PRC-barrel domain